MISRKLIVSGTLDSVPFVMPFGVAKSFGAVACSKMNLEYVRSVSHPIHQVEFEVVCEGEN